MAGKRFSDHFGLGKSQAQLDFCDIPLHTDLPLFVDPYALSLDRDPLLIVCHNLVVDYFQNVIDAIKSGNNRRARNLLSFLREPNDTHLGMSRGRPSGRGVGVDQASAIYDRLIESKAVRTGHLRDLEDAELMIPGIGPDKISDITTNIVREALIAYTNEQCALHNIPTQSVPSGMFWDPETANWRNKFVELPVYMYRRIILVPKVATRYRMAVDHEEFYRKHVLEYLEAEHIEAGSSLVSILKNGKIRVYKKDLEKEYPLSKDFLYRFTEEHPRVLSDYKESLANQSSPPTDAGIEARQPDPRDPVVEDLISELRGIEPGHAAASTFHDFTIRALTAIFYPSLVHPVKEQEIHHGIKRVDIRFTNRSTHGFFHAVAMYQRLVSTYVLFECKNYSRDVGNPEVDQLRGRFSNSRSMVGFLVVRSIRDKDALLDRCKLVLNDRAGYILVLDDDDIVSLLMMRAKDDSAGIDAILDSKLAELVM